VLSVSGVLIVVAAILVSANVSDHLQQTAVAEAVRTTEAVVRGYIDPSITPEVLANPSSPQGAALNTELQRLVSAETLLRIKVWAPDGTVVFSDLPALRGRRFPVADDLTEVLKGSVSTEFSHATDEENIFERGLADELLSIYLPIRPAGGGQVIGAYEVYEGRRPDHGRHRQDPAGRLPHRRRNGPWSARSPVRRLLHRVTTPDQAEPIGAPAIGQGDRPDGRSPSQPGAVPLARPELR